MTDETINPKRIRDRAPYRKSMSLTEEDIMRATELERLFTSRYSSEAPFNFSKTISKALELAIAQMLQPKNQDIGGPVQQSLSGVPADPVALQARLGEQGTSTKPVNQIAPHGDLKQGRAKKFQKTKRGF